MDRELNFDGTDRWVIVLLCIACLFGAALFFIYINALGLTSYAHIGAVDPAGDAKLNYFSDALQYRERRLTLALILRTFVSSAGFTVGLVLSVVGGVFILRRATAGIDASGSIGLGAKPVARASAANRAAGGEAAADQPAPAHGDDGAEGDGGKPGPDKTPPVDESAGTEIKAAVSQASFSLVSNSPGIIFMVGGVLVIYLTQALAIPVSSHEIVPAEAMLVCSDAANRDSNIAKCPKPSSSMQQLPVAGGVTPGDEVSRLQGLLAFCNSKPEDEDCKAVAKLQDRLSGETK